MAQPDGCCETRAEPWKERTIPKMAPMSTVRTSPTAPLAAGPVNVVDKSGGSGVPLDAMNVRTAATRSDFPGTPA